MSDNKYSWNETLKFSWGHIIAFVALIFISYVAYMGDFYSNGGDFKSSALKVLLIDVGLIFTFIGAQIYKGIEEKFNRSIIIERILICLCPVVFVLAMIPYNHFWSVFEDREKIEPMFASAVEKSRQMFVEYDKYSEKRILSYSQFLSDVIANKEEDRQTYLKVGFTDVNDKLVQESYVTTLKLQLLSQNTDSLRISALKWIDDTNHGVSVWNAFLVGNIALISDAIEGWNQKLYEVSVPVLSNETVDSTRKVVPFDQNRETFKVANNELNSLCSFFVNKKGISFYTIISGCLLFLMLLFPYFLQKRNEKAKGYYSLIPKLKKTNKQLIVEKDSVVDDQSEDHSSNDIFGGTF